MPITVIKLPARSGTLEYSEEDQAATLEMLSEVDTGEGVAIDVAQETENKARVRARVMVKLITPRVHEDYRIRVHTVKVADDQYVPALSLVKKTPPAAATEPEPEPEPEPAPTPAPRRNSGRRR